MKFLTFFLVICTAARALTVSGETSLIPGAGINGEAVVVLPAGTLILQKPGTYTAESWKIQGEMRLGEMGSYILVATGSGGFSSDRASKVTGNGSQLALVSAGPVSLGASIEPALSITSTIPFAAVSLTPLKPLGASPLVNLSTRTSLAAGQTTTLGFVVGGQSRRTVLIRAIGPTLTTFGVANALPTPTLTLFDTRGTNMASNSGWNGNPEWASIFFNVGAFPLAAGSKDAVILASLEPGPYSIQVAGGVGEVLSEVYYVE